MNSRERHTITQKIKHLAQSCATYPSLSKSVYAPIIKKLYESEGIDVCVEYFEMIHRINAKDNIVFLDSVFAQHSLSWFEMSSSNGKALFKLFEKHDIKIKPLCKEWVASCIKTGNLEGLRWVMGVYQNDFDFEKPRNAIAFLRRAKPNPASLYFCQALKQSDVIKETFLKEPDNFEEMSAYHSLAPEFRVILQIKEEKKQIEEFLDSIPLAPPTQISSSLGLASLGQSTANPLDLPAKKKSKI